MRFKEYLITEHSKNTLNEELVYGGTGKVFRRLQYWFDFGPRTVNERIYKLRRELVNAGGPNKFAMIVRRIPSVKHFIKKHKDELTGDLADVAKLI